MRNDIVEVAEVLARKTGGAVNIAMLVAFGYATFRLSGAGADFMTSAGGLPALSRESMTALAHDPDLPRRASYWAAAWLCLVGGIGTGFMTALGIRWAFHALVRFLNAMKV